MEELESRTLFNVTRVKDILPGAGGSLPREIVSLTTGTSTIAVFTAEDANGDRELWRSDGTTNGTVRIKDIRAGATGSDPFGLTVMGNQVYFFANDGQRGYELWRSDGTFNGTDIVLNINAGAASSVVGSATFSGFIIMNGFLYFSATSGGLNNYELWRSDGTDNGTVMVKDIAPGNQQSSSPKNFVVAHNLVANRDYLYFNANDQTNGWELWESDGDPNNSTGTRIIGSDINPGNASTDPRNLVVYREEIYFNGFYPGVGRELLRYSSGTDTFWPVKDIRDGPASSDPQNLYVHGNKVYFSANDGQNGRELWVSDGTAAGTRMLANLNQAGARANASNLTWINELGQDFIQETWIEQGAKTLVGQTFFAWVLFQQCNSHSS